MQKFHLPDLFAGLPWQVRFALIAGGTLISAFAGRLPESLQDAGLYCGIALIAYGVSASIWHEINKRRTISIGEWLHGRFIDGRDWFSEWCKNPRLNPLPSVITLLIVVTVVGAWLNNGKKPIEASGQAGREPKRHTASIPTVIPNPPGSILWKYEDTLSLSDAAKEAYSETRTSFAAHLAEANDATADQILLWYSYGIINFADVWGERPPSDKIEKLDLRGFALTSKVLGYSHYVEAPIPGFSASYVDLRLPKDSLEPVIEKIRAINSKPEWAPATLTISAQSTFIPAAPIPTSVRILFGPESVPPKEIQSQNVTWRAIEETGHGLKALGLTDPEWSECYSPVAGIAPQKCYVPYKFLELVLSFPKPITFKNIKVTAVQGDKPKWTKVIMTATDAILRFSYYPSDELFDIEATDEEANDQKK